MLEFRLESHDYNGRYLYVECTQEPVPAENKSLIHWTLTVTGGKSSYYTTGPTTLKIGARQVYYSPIVYYNAPKFPAAKGSVSGTLEVSHREDGSQSLEISLETAIYTSTLKTAKGLWELRAIDRPSTLGATDCFIGSACMVLVDRKNSAYTHTLALHTDGLEGYLTAEGELSTQPVRLSATALSFSVPEAFYEKIPNDRKLECRVVCTTYLGDTQIGESQSCSFYASCREEDCLPLVGGSVTDCNEKTLSLTGDENTLVRFFSQAACQIEAEARKGAVITKRQINGLEVEGDALVLPNVETGTFLFSATDSRLYRGEFTLEKPLIAYRKLTANCTLRRQAPTSDKVELTVSGDWWAGNFGAAENALEAVCRVGDRELPLSVVCAEDTYTAAVTVEELPYDKASFLTVTVADKLMTLEIPLTVNPGVPVFDWGQKDFAFHVPVTLADGYRAVSEQQLQKESDPLRAYPVNSIYIAWDHKSPAELFGGVWERVLNPQTGEGVFLFGCTGEEEIGRFGGAATVALTEEELPSHSHGFLDYWSTSSGSANRFAVALNGDGDGLGDKANDRSYTANAGGGKAHNNMPPYATVSIWRRIE